jgi:hypothetical protein
MLGSVPTESQPGGLVRRWEALPTQVQAALAFPVFCVLLGVVNFAVFNQPVGRSVLYGLIEGLPLTVLLLLATNNERRKRQAAKPRDRERE